jgi:3-deoxy-manno-octulosonate cytidylyltransferase (CMP-KDO synthetase)
MIEHVFRRARLCAQVDEVYVATCDDEIRAAAQGFGAQVIMTSATHERAGDRVAEAAEHFAGDVIVMIQGDEPMITPAMVAASLAPASRDIDERRVNWTTVCLRRTTPTMATPQKNLVHEPTIENLLAGLRQAK